ncbi:DUF6603 domain-containing protein [Microdochium nivale]|nr:DUF6603 domain-containing protein [Microdochium nivale]
MTDAKYYICSSKAARPSDGADYTALDANANKDVDIFVGLLRDGQLVLKSKPAAASASPGGAEEKDTVPLDAEDGTAVWFRTVGGEATSVHVTVAGASNKLDSLSIQIAEPWSLTFSSDAAMLNAAFGPRVPAILDGKDRIPAPGVGFLVPEGFMTLCCALDLDKTDLRDVTSTVQGLADYVGLTGTIPTVFASLQVNMSKDLALSHPSRNALWFEPGYSNRTTIRLLFSLTRLGELEGYLQNALGDRFFLDKDPATAAHVVCKKVIVAAEFDTGPGTVDQGSMALSMTAGITGTGVKMALAIEFWEDSLTLTITITLRKPELKAAFDDICAWLAELSGVDIGTEIKTLRDKDTLFGVLLPRRISVDLGFADKSGKPSLDSFGFDLEVPATFGTYNAEDGPVLFLLSYSWARGSGGFGTLSGKLWNDFDVNPDSSLSPGFETWLDLQPDPESPPPAMFIDIRKVIPGQTLEVIPDSVPTQITRAHLTISSTMFSLGGTITAEPVAPTSVPQPQLGELSVDASYSWNEGKDFYLGLGIMASIVPPVNAVHQESAVLLGRLEYASSKPKPAKPSADGNDTGVVPADGNDPSGASTRGWILKASLNGLYASTLCAFFDTEDAEHVTPLIDSIVLDTLSVEYTYASSTSPKNNNNNNGNAINNAVAANPVKKVSASHFKIYGKLLVADVYLDLTFENKKTSTGASEWQFDANMGVQDAETTVGDVLTSLLGDGSLGLPPFVADMKLANRSDNGTKIFTLSVSSKPGAPGNAINNNTNIKQPKDFNLTAQLFIGELALSFVQIHGGKWDAKSPSKRLVRASLHDFGLDKIDIPLVGTVPQPFDELYFFWVQDPPIPGLKTSGVGLRRGDVDLINCFLTDKLVPKDKFNAGADGKKNSDDLLVTAGCHFGVIIEVDGKRSCLLDYDFKKQTPVANKGIGNNANNSGRGGRGNARVARALGAPPPDNAVTKPPPNAPLSDGSGAQAPLKKQLGPLSVTNLGLQFVDKKLRISLDATFEIGPLAFSILGLGIDLDIKTLSARPDISVSIEGLAAAFDKPPVTIAGVIRHGKSDTLEYYAGGLIVGFVPWQFMAAGFYGDVKPPDGQGSPYKSIFIFAKLEGPLVTLEFATISGVTGGIGYNSSVRLPGPAEISQFPFIKTDTVGGAGDALEALEKLTNPKAGGWFSPKVDTFWIAAGMKVDAFEMLAIDAVVVVQLGVSTKLAIFAVGTADIPTKKSPFKIAHVELGLGVSVDFDYGVLKVEAQLQPNSYILHPDCRLTGGFGLYYWFAAPHSDPSLTGSFVFTLGGYHQAFVVPSGWPNPPRLGISWSMGSNLSISGQAYFAVTPKACMAGGRLHALFSLGPLSAWFDAFADFLINFRPFYFTAQAGISVGVRISIDIWFIHTQISAEIGAQLYLWGPPLAGRVHVNFWVMGFDINFGDDKRGADPVTLQEFYDLVLSASAKQQQTTRSTRAAALPAPEARVTDVSDLEDDAEISALSGPNRTHSVKTDGHLFMCSSGLVNHSTDPDKDVRGSPWTVRGGVFSFTVACKMAVRAAQVNDQAILLAADDQEVFSRPMRLREQLTSELSVRIVSTDPVTGIERHNDDTWGVERHVKPVPSGLWQQYDSASDPLASTKKNNIDDLLDGKNSGTIPLMMGVSLTAPPPRLSKDPDVTHDVEDASLTRIRAQRRFPYVLPLDADDAEKKAEPAFAPAPPLTGDTQEEKAKQWDAVHGAWDTATQDARQAGFVDGWAAALGWKAAGVAKVKGLGGMPTRLRSRKVFDNIYVAAPLLSVG